MANNANTQTAVALDKTHAATLKQIANSVQKATGLYIPMSTLLNGALGNGGMEAVQNYAKKLTTTFGG